MVEHDDEQVKQYPDYNPANNDKFESIVPKNSFNKEREKSVFEIPKDTRKIYTDGSSRMNRSGYTVGAFAFLDTTNDYSESGAFDNVTSQQMELTGGIRALEYCLKHKDEIKNHIEICTDSQYLQQGMVSWKKRWKKEGWMRFDVQKNKLVPIKNQEMWMKLDELDREVKQTTGFYIYWTKVKAHVGIKDNERVDMLCKEAVDKFIDKL